MCLCRCAGVRCVLAYQCESLACARLSRACELVFVLRPVGPGCVTFRSSIPAVLFRALRGWPVGIGSPSRRASHATTMLHPGTTQPTCRGSPLCTTARQQAARNLGMRHVARSPGLTSPMPRQFIFGPAVLRPD